MISKPVAITLGVVSSVGILSLASVLLRPDAMTVSAACKIKESKLGREIAVLKVSGRNLSQPVTLSVEGSKFVKTENIVETENYDMESTIDADKGEVLDAEFTAPSTLKLNVQLLCE